MREKINTIRHLGVLFITVIIFFLGVFIGGGVEELRVDSLYTQLQEQDLEYQNVVTESSYIEFLISQKQQNESQISCEQISSAYYSSIDNLDNSREKLEGYLDTASSNEEEFIRLESHYSNTQINYLTLAQKISELCGDSMNTIIYFYGNDDKCPECEDQGVYLDYVKQQLGDDILIFSFDIEKEGPIQLIRRVYGVDFNGELPVLIINGDQRRGFSTSSEVIDSLCEDGLNHSVCTE